MPDYNTPSTLFCNIVRKPCVRATIYLSGLMLSLYDYCNEQNALFNCSTNSTQANSTNTLFSASLPTNRTLRHGGGAGGWTPMPEGPTMAIPSRCEPLQESANISIALLLLSTSLPFVGEALNQYFTGKDTSIKKSASYETFDNT